MLLDELRALERWLEVVTAVTSSSDDAAGDELRGAMD